MRANCTRMRGSESVRARQHSKEPPPAKFDPFDISLSGENNPGRCVPSTIARSGLSVKSDGKAEVVGGDESTTRLADVSDGLTEFVPGADLSALAASCLETCRPSLDSAEETSRWMPATADQASTKSHPVKSRSIREPPIESVVQSRTDAATADGEIEKWDIRSVTTPREPSGATNTDPSCTTPASPDASAIHATGSSASFVSTWPLLLTNHLGEPASGVGRNARGASDAAVSLHTLTSYLAARIEEAIRTASVSDAGQPDKMCVTLRTEVAGDVEVHLTLGDNQTTIEILAAPASAHFLENERTSLEARIRQAAGVDVEISVVANREDQTQHGREMQQQEFGRPFQSAMEGRSGREHRSQERERDDMPASSVPGTQSRLHQSHAGSLVGGGARGLRL